jgi:hypothetical protein
LLGEHCANKADQGVAVGKAVDDVGALADAPAYTSYTTTGDITHLPARE